MAELNSSPAKTTGRRTRKRLSTRVDLTAMVDLAFLLITFFILTTTMQKEKAFGITMPEDIKPPEPLTLSDKRTMTICLGKNDQVVSYLGMTEKPLTDPKVTGYGKEGLRKAIIDTKELVTKTTGKDVFIIIKPSAHSDYENLVGTLDELHIAGATGYAIEDITAKEITLLQQKAIY